MTNSAVASSTSRRGRDGIRATSDREEATSGCRWRDDGQVLQPVVERLRPDRGTGRQIGGAGARSVGPLRAGHFRVAQELQPRAGVADRVLPDAGVVAVRPGVVDVLRLPTGGAGAGPGDP